MFFSKKLWIVLLGCTFLSPIAVNAQTCNPNATTEARSLLQYLINITGTKMLSGQESMVGDGSFPSKRDQFVNQKTGKYPAIYCSDFVDGSVAQRPTVINNCIAYHNKGSIIALQYHMVQPDLANGAGFSAMNIKGSGYTKIPDILTPGSSLNTEFNKRLDELAGYFKTLQDNNIAILWRPFHEMNGDWFWWSYQPRFKDLWIYTWNYLTNTKKCNNLVWVFGVNYFAKVPPTDKQSPSYYYPGNDYVDVLGCDFYTMYGYGYDKQVYDTLLALGGGKPIGIAENGTMADIPTLRQTQPKWSYWVTWWGFEGSDKGNTDALYTKNYSDPSVITQDEIVIPTVSISQRLNNVLLDNKAVSVFRFTMQQNGVLFTTKENCIRVELYELNGQRVMSFTGNTGVIANDKVFTGAYVLKAIGNNGEVWNTKVNLLRN